MRIGENTTPTQSLSESITKKRKRTSIKHLMKNKYLIAKPTLVTRTLIHQK